MNPIAILNFISLESFVVLINSRRVMLNIKDNKIIIEATK